MEKPPTVNIKRAPHFSRWRRATYIAPLNILSHLNVPTITLQQTERLFLTIVRRFLMRAIHHPRSQKAVHKSLLLIEPRPAKAHAARMSVTTVGETRDGPYNATPACCRILGHIFYPPLGYHLHQLGCIYSQYIGSGGSAALVAAFPKSPKTTIFSRTAEHGGDLSGIYEANR